MSSVASLSSYQNDTHKSVHSSCLFYSYFAMKTDEQNFNLDEQPDLQARQALAEHDKGEDRLERDKRDADEQVNNDEKPDDEEIALQEGN